jgi:hypothetical protein
MFGNYSGSFVGRDLSYYVKALPFSTLTLGPILLTGNMSGRDQLKGDGTR